MFVPAHAPPPPRKEPSRRFVRPRTGLVLLLLLGLVAIGAVLAVRSRTPLLPIPVPTNLGTLDPQVRAHLAQLAQYAAKAPHDAERRADLGLAFAVNGLWLEARQCFTNTLTLGGPSPLPALYGAVALQELGDDPGALQELQQLTRDFPSFAPGWHRLGRALASVGRFQEAAEAFTTLTRRAPQAWHGWAGVGEAMIRAGQGTNSLKSLEHARRLAPAERSIRHLLAQAYRSAGRTAEADREAAASNGETLSPMPDDWSLRALNHMKSMPDQFERTNALLAAGNADEAIARLEVALRYHPGNVAVIAALVRAMNAGNRATEGSRILAPVLANHPGDLSLRLAAVENATALEQPAAALSHADDALAIAPNAAEAHVAKANAMLAANRDAEAAQSLAHALTLAPRNADLWVQLGDLRRYNLNQAPEATQAYLQARATDPLHRGALLRLAESAIEQRDVTTAERWISELMQLGADPALVGTLRQRLASPP